MISYLFVPISSHKGVLFFETPGITYLFSLNGLKLPPPHMNIYRPVLEYKTMHAFLRQSEQLQLFVEDIDIAS